VQPLPGRLIGIDVGRKRVGLSRTDPMQLFPSAVGTFSPSESLEEIARQVRSEGPVAGFVVGMPRRHDEGPSEAETMVESYLKKLRGRFPDIPVHVVDEFLSSREAVGILVRSGVPKHKRREKGRIDQAAASVILQRYLESKVG
jgi:putative Holliday junction resolvase